jgi:anti-sigma factor ChrR (cupin superfamily)
MNCISPPELSDRQLLEFLDGEAEPETTHHLGICQYCRNKADALARLQNGLTTRLYRITCPSPLELGEYHLRILPSSQMLVVAQHVRECPHCGAEVAQLETFLKDLTPDVKPAPLTPIRVLVARLVGGNESALRPALRGESKGPLIFEADGVVITLDIQPASETQVSILGQVAADEQDQWTNALVELQQADKPPMTTSLDDLGAFRFEAVRPGVTQIMITSTEGVVIQSPNIDIAV